jgi:hypothetical protein
MIFPSDRLSPCLQKSHHSTASEAVLGVSLVARLPTPRCGGQACDIWRLATRRAARLGMAAGRPIRRMAAGSEASVSSAWPLTAWLGFRWLAS